MSDMHRLYSITHSLYSGRARSYLIKQGIPFREMSTGHESFKAEVLPKGKLATIPTLVTPEGEVIRDGAAIIDAILALSKTLNLRVIAEGIENERQLDYLVTKKCDLLQGFYFSQPIYPEDVPAMLRQNFSGELTKKAAS